MKKILLILITVLASFALTTPKTYAAEIDYIYVNDNGGYNNLRSVRKNASTFQIVQGPGGATTNILSVDVGNYYEIAFNGNAVSAIVITLFDGTDEVVDTFARNIPLDGPFGGADIYVYYISANKVGVNYATSDSEITKEYIGIEYMNVDVYVYGVLVEDNFDAGYEFGFVDGYNEAKDEYEEQIANAYTDGYNNGYSHAKSELYDQLYDEIYQEIYDEIVGENPPQNPSNENDIYIVLTYVLVALLAIGIIYILFKKN